MKAKWHCVRRLRSDDYKKYVILLSSSSTISADDVVILLYDVKCNSEAADGYGVATSRAECRRRNAVTATDGQGQETFVVPRIISAKRKRGDS